MQTENDPNVRGGWGHSQNLVHLKVAGPLADWAAVRDRLAITQVMVTYGWCVDEHQFGVMDEILTDNMVFSGCVVGQGPFETMPRDVLIPWVKDFMEARSDQTRHTFSNCVVTDQTSDTAIAISYMTLLSTTTDESKVLATSFYNFTLRKVDEQWKISAVYTGFDRQF